MKKSKNVLSEKVIRIICLLGMIVLLCSIVIYMLYNFNNKSYTTIDKIIFLSSDIISFLLFLFVFIFPKRYGVLTIISLFFSILNLGFAYKEDFVMGLFMYYLTISVFVFRGYFYNHKKLKIVIATVFLLGLLTSQLRFGVNSFIENFVTALGFTLVASCILFFLFEFQRNKNLTYLQSRILDLSDYKDDVLTKNDKEWVELALTNTKYDSIARQYGCSEGHVKNRMRYIFATLDLIDRIDLFSKYAGCTVIKNKEELKKWKEEVLFTNFPEPDEV